MPQKDKKRRKIIMGDVNQCWCEWDVYRRPYNTVNIKHDTSMADCQTPYSTLVSTTMSYDSACGQTTLYCTYDVYMAKFDHLDDFEIQGQPDTAGCYTETTIPHPPTYAKTAEHGSCGGIE